MTSSQYTQWMVHLYQRLAEQTGSVVAAESLRRAKQLKLFQLIRNPLFSHNTGLFNQINELLEVVRYECTTGERSSAVEHTVHIGVVTGSIPVAPTTPRKHPSTAIDQQPFEAVRPKRLAGLRPDPFRVFNAKKTA